jgi:hypothetical protein
MYCQVIQDLLILYADKCCSEESKSLVEEHLKSCGNCRKALAEMRDETKPVTKAVPVSLGKLPRVNEWQASVLQSVLLFVSFALLIFGVSREAATPEGVTNGLWSLALIVPVTGFLLSLANWYFIRLYPSKKAFSACSILVTAAFILLGYVWALLHYRSSLVNLFNGSALSTGLLILGCVLVVALCAASKLFSDRYALLLGKE